jgi:hydrogenase maturation protease
LFFGAGADAGKGYNVIELGPEGTNRILVLGVGNTLLHDEGLGVRVVENLEQDYEFSENVELLDGGCAGLRLTEVMTRSDKLIVVDVVKNGHPAGTVYRLDGDDLRLSLTFKQSMHETDLMETMACCEIIGHRPDCVVLGMEPENIEPWGLDFSDPVNASLPKLTEMVLHEIIQAGGSYRPRVNAPLAPAE